MHDTFVKTIDAEPAAVARQLVRMDAHRELAERLGESAAGSITVTPALEGAAVAIRIEPPDAGDVALRAWPATAAEAGRHARRMLRDLAIALKRPAGGLAAAA